MKSILIYFTMENDLSLTYITWFVESFSIVDFNGIEKLVYLFLQYCARLGIVAKRKYLESFLRTDGKASIFDYNIKLEDMGQYDYLDSSALEQAFRVISSAMFTYYDESVKQEMNDRVFKVDIDIWLNSQKRVLLQKAMADNFPRLQEGNRPDDIIIDLLVDLERIADTYDVRKLDTLDFLRPVDVDDITSGKSRRIAKTLIPCIDGNGDGGIYEEDIITFTGLTGSGKTRFAMRIAYNCVVFGKVNARVDTLELSKSQIENMLIAMHIVTIFRGEVKIPDSAMTRGELSNDQMTYYLAAKNDLFNSDKYGKFFINDSKLFVDKFYKKSITWMRLHKDFKLWFIDYAGNVKISNDYRGRPDKAEMIEILYESIRDIGKDTGAAFFVLNQYNKSGADKAAAGKRIDQGDIQGGQTVHKWTTFNMYTTQTPEQLAASVMNITCDKARFAARFNNVPFKNDLSISKFTQMRKEVVN